nr:histidine kinase [Algoriphagus sp.]
MAVNVLGESIELINKSFYTEWENYFGVAEFFAFIWAIAMWINNSKQRKALEQEKLKALAREKEFKITESLKNQLERQVEQRTKELTEQKNELENTLSELRAAQNQLIHAEKMASL